METLSWLRVLMYLFLGATLAQVSTVTPHISTAIRMTAGFFGINSISAVFISLGQAAWRDLWLGYIVTPYLILTTMVWMRTFWQIGVTKFKYQR